MGTLPRIRKSVLTLALPVTVSSLLQRAEGIVAVFLVGGLGATSIAAVGLGQLLAFIATTLVSGLSVGANVLIAQLWGARRTRDGENAATQLLVVGFVVSLILMAAGILFNRGAMSLLGAHIDLINYAEPYSDLIFIVIPFTVLLHTLTSILQGTGDTRTPMFVLIGINLLHVALAYPLIYGLWGFPAWGLTGAAVAVGVAEGTGFAYLLWACRHLIRLPSTIRRDLLHTTWRIGAPVSGERVFQQVGVMVYTKIVLLYGTVTYAAHQVGLSIESLSFLPGYGFAIAAATMVGQSIGAGKYVRAKMENWEANRLAAGAMAMMGVVFFFFPYVLLRTFTDDASVIELGTTFLRVVALLQIPLALTMVLAGSLRGAGDTPFIMWATTVGMWGVRVPWAIVAGFFLKLDILFVWSAMIADWTVRMGMLLWRYRSERWRSIQVIEQPSKKLTIPK